MKAGTLATKTIIQPSVPRFVGSPEKSFLLNKIVAPKSNEEYLKNSQIKYARHLESNMLQKENAQLHKISKRSALRKKLLDKSRSTRNLQQVKAPYSSASLAGRGRRENTRKGRLKRNIIDSTSKDVSEFKGPMRISLLVDGLSPSAKGIKRNAHGIRGEEAAWSQGKGNVRTFHSKGNVIYPDEKVSGQGKGSSLTVEETAAAEALDLTKYAEDAQQPHVNIRRKRVYDILDHLFPPRRKRKIQPETFDRRLYDSGTRKSVGDQVEANNEKGKGTLSQPMFGYSYNRVEDDSALNAKFLFA